jgi:hypothetical protein
MPVNEPGERIVSYLLKAWQLYKVPEAIILMLISEGLMLIFESINKLVIFSIY